MKGLGTHMCAGVLDTTRGAGGVPPYALGREPVKLRLRVNPISLSYPFPFVLPLALVPRNRVVSARGENIPLWNETPLGYGYVIVIVASWLLRHQRRQVLITNFQDAVCKCVYVDCVGFISDVFAIVMLA